MNNIVDKQCENVNTAYTRSSSLCLRFGEYPKCPKIFLMAKLTIPRFHTYAQAPGATLDHLLHPTNRVSPSLIYLSADSLSLARTKTSPKGKLRSTPPRTFLRPTLREAEPKPAQRMTMEYTSLELRVISCKDLRAFNFFQKLSAFVTVSIVPGDGDPQNQQLHPALQHRHRTPTSKGGHRNPEWNHVVGFDLSAVSPRDYAGLSLRFDVRLRLPSVVGSRSIGEVRASLGDLVDDFTGPVQFRRYQVKNDDGKGIGVLNFTYKLCGNESGGDELARVEPSPEAPVPGHNATNLEWPSSPPRALIRRILSSQRYSPSFSLQTTNEDVNRASTGYGYRNSWYSMVGTAERSC